MKETSSELQSPPFVPGPLPLLTCLFWMEQSCWCCSVQPGSNKHQSLSANFCGNLTLNTPGAPCPTPALHPEILYCSASRTKLFFSQQGSSDASPYPTRPAKCLDEESTKELPPHPPASGLPSARRSGMIIAPPEAQPLHQPIFAKQRRWEGRP